MKANRKWLGLVAVAAAGMVLAGCNAGMAPEGDSKEQADKVYNDMPLDKKIEYINSGPFTADKKAQMIKEAKQKAGVKDDGSAPAPAAGAGGAGVPNGVAVPAKKDPKATPVSNQ